MGGTPGDMILIMPCSGFMGGTSGDVLLIMPSEAINNGGMAAPHGSAAWSAGSGLGSWVGLGGGLGSWLGPGGGSGSGFGYEQGDDETEAQGWAQNSVVGAGQSQG